MAKKEEYEIVIMNFSGIYHRESFYEGEKTAWVEVQGLPGSNCYCDEEAFRELQEKIREFPVKGIHFIDSGNYHYMSRIWLEKIKQPFRLLVFDNHTDMQQPAFGGILSCGGWIADSILELPFLEEVFLCGPDEEAFCQVPDEIKEKVRFLSRERLQKGQDGGVEGQNACENFFKEFPTDLPVYLSIDKDVLCQQDAHTTWSQGDMRITELTKYLEIVLERFKEARQQIAGVDICGECDPDQQTSSAANDRANEALLEIFLEKRDRP